MSQVIRTTGVRHAIFGLALAGLAMSSMTKAIADDFDAPAYRPYPNGTVEGGEICRIFHERLTGA